MENEIKAAFADLKKKGWKNNYFALKAIRAKFIKLGASAITIWKLQAEGGF